MNVWCRITLLVVDRYIISGRCGYQRRCAESRQVACGIKSFYRIAVIGLRCQSVVRIRGRLRSPDFDSIAVNLITGYTDVIGRSVPREGDRRSISDRSLEIGRCAWRFRIGNSRLICNKWMRAFNRPLHAFCILAISQCVLACSDIHLLNIAAGYIPFGIFGFNIIIHQLIAVIRDIAVIEISDICCRNLLHNGFAARLPIDPVDILTQIAHIHRVLYPLSNLGGINTRHTGGRQGRRVIYLKRIVRSIGCLITVRTDFDLDVTDAAGVEGVGINGEYVVKMLQCPALCLADIGAARIVRVTLRPPYGRAGLVFGQLLGYIRLGKE
ncbi:hypothetical protein D3C75_789360 [compost metagenome]